MGGLLEATAARRSVSEDARWLLPFAVARLAATAIAIVLVSPDPAPEDLPMLAYGVTSTGLLVGGGGLRASRAVWSLDFAAGLLFVGLSGDWRSPYYLLWLTSLVLPAAALSLRRASLLAAAAPLAFLAVAFLGGPDPGRLEVRSTETLAIHLSLPFLLTLAIAYAASTVRELQRERADRERMAVQAERRRIAWELHDSAKQRLHAAHLLVSSLQGRLPDSVAATVTRAVVELESAASDMDTSLAELHSPLEGRPLDEALRARAAELGAGTSVAVSVTGRAPRLAPLIAAHVYRIAAEALTNALRHADARTVAITLEPREDQLVVGVRDDGQGMPGTVRAGATGMLAMHSRAASIGAALDVAPSDPPPGTTVRLVVPLATPQEEPA